MLQERCHLIATRFGTWRVCSRSYWSTVCYKNYRPSNRFKEFLEIYNRRLSTHSDMWRHFGPQTKYILSSHMWKQLLSRGEMTYYWPYKLCRLNRIIKISNRTGVSTLITDPKQWQRSKFLWRWRPGQVEYMLQKFYSQLLCSLMMAMIVILKCGDVEVNPGPQTSKLKCHYLIVF